MMLYRGYSKLPLGPFPSAGEIADAIDPWRTVGIDSGDARYLLVAEVLDAVSSEFSERGAIPWKSNQLIWARWNEKLPRIISAADAPDGAREAHCLLSDVLNVLARPWTEANGGGGT
jgi:hypothetical protein